MVEAGGGSCRRKNGGWWGQGQVLLTRVKPLSSYSICFPHIGPSLENAYPVLLSGAWRNQVVSRILRERRLWLGREAPLWIVLLTRTEYRHERDRAPTETDTVPAGTPTPVSVIFMTAP